jgi:hypothetical protein
MIALTIGISYSCAMSAKSMLSSFVRCVIILLGLPYNTRVVTILAPTTSRQKRQQSFCFLEPDRSERPHGKAVYLSLGPYNGILATYRPKMLIFVPVSHNLTLLA